MANAEEKTFADGFSFKRNENSPEWVVGRLSIKVEDAITFLKKYENKGWVNLNVNTARSGNIYCELDTWKPTTEQGTEPKAAAAAAAESEDLPF